MKGKKGARRIVDDPGYAGAAMRRTGPRDEREVQGDRIEAAFFNFVEALLDGRAAIEVVPLAPVNGGEAVDGVKNFGGFTIRLRKDD